MIGSGQTNNPQMYNQGMNQGYGGYNQGMNPGYYQQGPTLPAVQQINNPFTKSGTNTHVNISGHELGQDGAKNYLWGQIGLDLGSMIGQTVVSYWNYNLQSQAQTNALTLGLKFYDTQNKIAGYQKDCVIRQFDSQDFAVTAQKDMHKDQILHEQVIVKLQNSLALKLAWIAESEKTNRFKIAAVNNSFHRSEYPMGSLTKSI